MAMIGGIQALAAACIAVAVPLMAGAAPDYASGHAAPRPKANEPVPATERPMASPQSPPPLSPFHDFMRTGPEAMLYGIHFASPSRSDIRTRRHVWPLTMPHFPLSGFGRRQRGVSM